jgi:hypothetical protein
VSRVVTEVAVPTVSPTKEEDEDVVEEDDMDVEYDPVAERDADVNSMIAGEREVEQMVVVEVDNHDDEEEEETAKVYEARPARVWPEVSTERAEHYKREVKKIRDSFEEELDMDDTTMVSEYAEEIYEYMCELEVRTKSTLPRFSLVNVTQICRRR